jgi:hypothetical protein
MSGEKRMSSQGNKKELCNHENGNESYDCEEDESLVSIPII